LHHGVTGHRGYCETYYLLKSVCFYVINEPDEEGGWKLYKQANTADEANDSTSSEKVVGCANEYQ